MKACQFFSIHWWTVTLFLGKLSGQIYRVLSCLVFALSMGDFQQFEQDFYQTGYYIDDQGHTVAYSYDAYDSDPSAYYDK